MGFDDMILTDDQVREYFGPETDTTSNNPLIAAAGIKDLSKRWPNNVIPYEISNKRGLSFTKDQKEIILGGIKRFNEDMAGCLLIRPKNSQDDYFVSVENNIDPSNKESLTGCRSYVGKAGYRKDEVDGRFKRFKSQPLNLDDSSCYLSHKTVAHEFIHAFGFTHEQNRKDRDDYVTYYPENVVPKKMRKNFRVMNNVYQTYTDKYDGRSIMHYSSTAFGEGKTTLLPKPNLTALELGQGDLPQADKWLTELDKEKLRSLYGCQAPECTSNYKVLDEADRNYQHQTNPDLPVYCDNIKAWNGIKSPAFQGSSWYRFMGQAGTKMPEFPYGSSTCQTWAPGWINGKHPTRKGQIVERLACFTVGENTCYDRENIKITNCGSFFLYFLPDITKCNNRYCAV